MRIFQMHANGLGAKGLAELNQHVEDDRKDGRAGVAGEGQGLSEEDESRIVQDAKVMNEGKIKSDQGKFNLLKPSEQPQAHEVCWEKFLPVRSLKILLVENDDSTRHVVSALLRNCSYEVTAVSNGFEAWKILKDLDNRIDLVLTEVVMPFLSGIGLLSKIMSHKTCKNIPVIMMSSHDSMGIVFKCLSNGAVDFLVKPIRKNELKNLWQHVWRKCHSSSGSGSESGTRTQKSTKSIGQPGKASSDDEDEARSIGLRVHNGSDNGSGTQSSWTKRAVEVESPQASSPSDKLADPPDSTCAQVIRSRPEAIASSWVPAPAKEHVKQDNLPEHGTVSKDLKRDVTRDPDSVPAGHSEKALTRDVSADKHKFPLLGPEKDGKSSNGVKLELAREILKCEWVKEGADIGASSADNQRGIQRSELQSNQSENPGNKKIITENVKELPSLELSLMRPGDADKVRANTQEQCALRHSVLSAFTRYNTVSTANQAQTAIVDSCSPLDNNSEAAKSDSMRHQHAHSDGTPPNQFSSSNNNDMGSTTNNFLAKSPGVVDKSVQSAINRSQPCSAFQPPQNDPRSAHLAMPSKAGPATVDNVHLDASDVGHQAQAQHCYNNHHHHHINNLQRLEQFQSHDDSPLDKPANAVLQCGSSSKAGIPSTVNAANRNLNGSGSGSNHGSNMQYESSNFMNAEGNVGSDDGVPGQGITGQLSGSGNGTENDQSWTAQREAALNKFRLKRKERCFEKKVRYQSRKKLAEQRPRVRGQFVRQVRENKSKDA